MSLSTVWDWKVEPESPGLAGLDPSEDVWLFDDGQDVVRQVTVVTEEDDGQDEKLGRPTTKAEVAAKLLADLDEWIKEEPFNDWLEEKIDLPIFEDLPSLDQRNKYKPLDTQALLQEFESVFGEVEFNNGALTPPQSPPLVPPPPYHPGDQLLLDIPAKMTYSIGSDGELVLLQTLGVPKVYHTIAMETAAEPKAYQTVAMETAAESKAYHTIAMETAAEPKAYQTVAMETTCALDELVRSRAADIIDTSCDPWETSGGSSESDFVLSPPESGSESSNSGLFHEDPEWVPVSVNPSAPGPGTKRKRGKPYARPVEDKRLRKKEQNKNAATRYRQKKKAEVDVILGEEKGLLDRNTDLHKNVDELSREIKYLKGLMRDLFRAKGILK